MLQRLNVDGGAVRRKIALGDNLLVEVVILQILDCHPSLLPVVDDDHPVGQVLDVTHIGTSED